MPRNHKNRFSPAKAILLLLLGTCGFGTVLAQQATYIKASNTGWHDFFGYSIAISGSTMITGATGEASNSTTINSGQDNNSSPQTGAAYVFVNDDAGIWSQQAYLKVTDTGAPGVLPNIGWSVAVSNDIAIVSSPLVRFADENGQLDTTGRGAAYVFIRNGNDWCEEVEVDQKIVCWQTILLASNGEPSDFFGSAVAISGDTVVIGDPLEDSIATGVNGDENDNSAQFAGAAYVFQRVGDNWIQQAYLKASNTGSDDRFGTSVAISGDTIVVGAMNESSDGTGVNSPEAGNDLATKSGAAYVFVRNEGVWTQQAYLKASNTDSNDMFGAGVSVSGDTIVVGASNEDSNATGINGDQSNNESSNSGAAYVFVRDGLGEWSQHSYLKASNSGPTDLFGLVVSVSGDTVAVSAEFEDSLVTDSGAVYVFTRDELGDWSELDYVKASNPGLADRVGTSLAVSGDLLVAGTWFEDSNATGINGDGNNNLEDRSGAAYAWVVSDLSSLDTTPPVVTAPADIFAFATGTLTEVELGIAQATDDSGVVESIVNNWPGGGFPVGLTVVTWTATDAAGNMGTDTQNVTIEADEEIVFEDGFEGD